MDLKPTANRYAALIILRTLIGLIFFMQGYGKVFNFGIENLHHSFFVQYESTFLPKWLIWFTVYYTSFTINFHGEEIQKGTNIRFYIYKNFKFPKSEKMKIQKLKTKESESKNRLSETTTF